MIRVNPSKHNPVHLCGYTMADKPSQNAILATQTTTLGLGTISKGKRLESRLLRSESALSDRDARLIEQAKAEHYKFLKERKAGNDAASSIWKQVAGR